MRLRLGWVATGPLAFLAIPCEACRLRDLNAALSARIAVRALGNCRYESIWGVSDCKTRDGAIYSPADAVDRPRLSAPSPKLRSHDIRVRRAKPEQDAMLMARQDLPAVEHDAMEQ